MTQLATNTIRLVLVDDHEVVRMGLRALFDRTGTVEVVGEADSVASAVREAVRLQPAVVLLDLRLPDGTGVEACRQILEHCPGTRVVFLTSFTDDDAVLSTVLAGARGYLLKTIGGPALIQAIHTVVQGQSILDPGIINPVLSHMRSLSGETGDHGTTLSPQERRILPLIAEGKTNKEIAASLGLSDKTVKSYLYNLFQKLQITRRAQAAAFFVKRSLS